MVKEMKRDTDSTNVCQGVDDGERLVITIKDAAAMLGVDPRTLSQGVKDGTIPAVQLGRRVLIPREPFLQLFTE